MSLAEADDLTLGDIDRAFDRAIAWAKRRKKG
jgi:hypothetical protein